MYRNIRVESSNRTKKKKSRIMIYLFGISFLYIPTAAAMKLISI